MVVSGQPGYKEPWLKAAEGIIARMADGRYPAGAWLPGLPQLSLDLGTSTRTAHQALSELHDKGLISWVERVGYYPGNGRPPRQANPVEARREVSAPAEFETRRLDAKQDSQPPDPSLDLLNKAEWLTVAELQTALRVSRVTAYRRVRSGAIPAIRVGRQYRIAASGARAYMNIPDIPLPSQPDSEHPQGGVEGTADGPSPATEKLLSISAVAERFGVGVRTVGYWDAQGRLKASSRTSGGHRRWREEDIARVLENSGQQSLDYRRRHEIRTEDIVRMREIEGMTWTAIARELGMTRWGIRCRYDSNKRHAATSAADATHKQPVSMAPDQPVTGVNPEAACRVLLPGAGDSTREK